MNRLLTTALLATALGTAATPAAATERCRPRPGEHQLARSARAVVLERRVAASALFAHQTLLGCSRRTGHRRVIDVLQHQDVDDPVKLIALRLAGTRTAYVMTRPRAPYDPDTAETVLVADDALHGGRRHELLASSAPGIHVAFSVDAAGDVVWRTQAAAELRAWRPGLGRRTIDARAEIRDVRLGDGILRWRRNGVPRSIDLATVPRSACRWTPSDGTLDVDIYDYSAVCLRASGRTVYLGNYVTGLVDVNGPYVVLTWVLHAHEGADLIDLTTGATTAIDASPAEASTRDGVVRDAVVDPHGSVAYLADGALWVRDTAGTRMVPGTGTGPLLRDGSTVTWSGGGPTVTLNP